jgi:nucleoid DNA-binding protein
MARTKGSVIATKAEDNTVEKKARVAAIKDRQTRMEILQMISDKTGLKRVDVESVFNELSQLVKGHLKKRGSGEFMIPKLGLKIKRVRRKPTKKRVMVSPLTGQEVVIPAKPARDDIKLIALKTLKASVD